MKIKWFDLKCQKRNMYLFQALMLLFFVTEALATSQTLGGMSDQIIKSFTSITKLITAGAYIAGVGFSVGAILKFKQHKDNPTNIPIGTPIALVFIAAALLFLPTILGVTGATMFSGGGTTAGPTGSAWTQQ